MDELHFWLPYFIYYYDSMEFSDAKNGVLWVTTEWSESPSRDKSFLLFSPNDNLETYKIAEAPEGFGHKKIIVMDDVFYFTATNDLVESSQNTNGEYEMGISHRNLG